MKKLLHFFQESEAFSEDNISFLEDLYEKYLKDPASVDASWREKFECLPFEETRPTSEWLDVEAIQKQLAVFRLIEQYRSLGHLVADNNPLKPGKQSEPAALKPESYGLGSSDMDSLFFIDPGKPEEKYPLRKIIGDLKETYCKNIGSEYTHILDVEIKEWIRNHLESNHAKGSFSAVQKHWLLTLLTAAEGIEKHLHLKYPGQKRFSLEGCESLIPLLDELIQRAGEQDVKEIVIGMAHRGRLNVLINILGKSPKSLFQEFEGGHTEPAQNGSGDVKYHMGFSSDVETPKGPLHLAMAFNPSHLECVDGVVEGSVRARQDRFDGDGETAILPVLIHGDAAFAGQGVVMETLNMTETPAYTTGGTLHIIINNQIGFTTSNPFYARSTLYCTDVAKMVQAPVFHVNADDPEAVLYVTQLAIDYRMKFKRDIVIDLICFRRHGHNEADEPAVTQPLMYQFIRHHPGTRKLYTDRLIAENIIVADEAKYLEDDYYKRLDQDEIVLRPPVESGSYYNKTRWDHFLDSQWDADVDTRLSPEKIHTLSKAMLNLPENFVLHPRAEAIIETRHKMAEAQVPIDWGYAENLAYASLLVEKRNIRISGQDVGRGTFFHRHAILYHQNNGQAHIPLKHLQADQGRFDIYDSLLSEEGVLGFEYGYSTTEPEALVIWEAQFGDFANGAQVIIDQFISSGETKWGRMSGLVLLLPHGQEGQGPEHSSARLERYLQLCAEHNLQVCVPTTPAQIFHLLRRQVLRPYRKPLIALTPKSLLRHKLAVSSLSELSESRFQTILGEIDDLNPKDVNRVILCCGKIYYELLEARRQKENQAIAILRIEQFYPFPHADFQRELNRYPNMKEVVWCQEEPKNQGAWHQIVHRFDTLAKSGVQLGYAGPASSASPSLGKMHRHLAQQKQVVENALWGDISQSLQE